MRAISPKEVEYFSKKKIQFMVLSDLHKKWEDSVIVTNWSNFLKMYIPLEQNFEIFGFLKKTQTKGEPLCLFLHIEPNGRHLFYVKQIKISSFSNVILVNLRWKNVPQHV